MRSNRLAILGFAAALTPVALGADLFVISGTSNGSPITPVGANNLVDLVTNAVNNEAQFAALTGTDVSLSLNYGGVADAVTITRNAAETQATLTFITPDGTITRTFDTGTDPRSLEDQIRDYLQQNGADDLAEFFKAVNALTPIAVSDGNPNATTARMAELTFQRFGINNEFTSVVVPDGDDSMRRATPQLRMDVSGSQYEAGDFEGDSATVSTSFDANLGKSLGVSIASFLGYNSVEDADVFHFGMALGVPIRVVLPTPEVPFTWQITPHASVAGSASEDIGAGGIIYSFGATSYFAWHATERLTLSMANQYAIYEGNKLSFGDYEIDPGVSQSMMKHGGRVTYWLGVEWYTYAGVTYSDFIDDAAVDNWLTFTGGIGFKNDAGSGFELAVTADDGDDYSSFGLRLGANLAF
ncbi:MAG: hypothetical protein IPK69_05465 [Phycisphaerales bacterium]|nr:MAG: hypothetical protein IPK69_05465 [Phycisphaerales bacterium]